MATLGVFLGSMPLPYATMLFSHTQVVACIAIALYAIQRGTDAGDSPRASWSWDLLAGFACGWVVASEYTAGLVVGGLFLWLTLQGWRRAIPFCLAAIPPLLLIPLYSWLCFGNPFLLPYSVNEAFPEMREGLYAIKLPDAQTAYNLLFSPTRGLFFWSPFLAWRSLATGTSRKTVRACSGSPTACPRCRCGSFPAGSGIGRPVPHLDPATSPRCCRCWLYLALTRPGECPERLSRWRYCRSD